MALAVNGATDPLVSGLASGVAGGEWWIGGSNITPVRARRSAARAPPSRPPPCGRHLHGPCPSPRRGRQLECRAQHGVRTATLTVTGPVPDAIFADGFETGAAPWAWSSRITATTTRLNVTASAALVGSFGLQAQGNGANYVQYTWHPPAGDGDLRRPLLLQPQRQRRHRPGHPRRRHHRRFGPSVPRPLPSQRRPGAGPDPGRHDRQCGVDQHRQRRPRASRSSGSRARGSSSTRTGLSPRP